MSIPSQPDSYRKMQVDSASPEMLILMLYDGALKFMSQADEAFKEKNFERVNNLLLKVQAIFTELLTSLNKEQGGEIAINLERLYLFFLEKLGLANVRKDPGPMLEIRPLIENLRNTWAQITKTQGKAPAGNQPALKPRLNVSV